MREPTPSHGLYGLVAEFREAEALIDAVRRTRAAGFTAFEAYSPFPLEEMTQTIGFRESRVPLATLLGGILGAAAGYGLQVYTNLDFPLNIGGRPIIAPPAFAMITFELMVLGAVVAAVLSMLLLNRLPKLHHPLFEVESFHLASSEAFFLVLQSNDPKFRRGARHFLNSLDPVRVDEVPFAEVPE